MMRTLAMALFFTVVTFYSEAAFCQNADLDAEITANFTVTASPPTLAPNSTMEGSLRALHAGMRARSYSGFGVLATTTTFGPTIVWGAGTVSSAANDAIVIATADNGTAITITGGNATADATGTDSSAYALAGDGHAPSNGDGGEARAECVGPNDGVCWAIGGDAGGLGNGGWAYAWTNFTGGTGLAVADAGSAENGDGGPANADGDGVAFAYGGSSYIGDGGWAEAIASTYAEARGGGGSGITSLGGTALAIAATGDANAYGGHGYLGGYAYAEADLDATAYGGSSLPDFFGSTGGDAEARTYTGGASFARAYAGGGTYTAGPPAQGFGGSARAFKPGANTGWIGPTLGTGGTASIN